MIEKFPTGEKNQLVWREIRANDIEDTKTVLSLDVEMLGSKDTYFPDDETLGRIRYEGLFLERRGEAIGYMRVAPPIFPSETFPPRTLVVNYAYLRPSEKNEETLRQMLDAIRTYASDKGYRNIGWFEPDARMHEIANRPGFDASVNAEGTVCIPLSTLNDETIARIIAHSQAAPGTAQ